MAANKMPGISMSAVTQQNTDSLLRHTGVVNGINVQADNNAQLEKEKEEILLDITQFILDISGIIDPTPISDGSNVLISLARGNWFDAFISAVSIIPFADIVKVAKFSRYLETVQKAIKLAKKDIRWAAELNEIFLKLKEVVDVVYDWGADVLSEAASKTLKQVKKEIDEFIEAYGKEPKQFDSKPTIHYNTGKGSGKASGVSTTKVEVGSEVKNTVDVPLSKVKIDEIIATPKGKRPLPEEYLSADYIKNHLSQFDEGSVRIVSKKAMQKYGTAGPDPAFVMPKPYVDKIIKEANGDIGKIEEALGFPKGSLDPDDMMVVEIPATNDIKIPSGNEDGANKLWKPGGVTSGGVPEVVISLPPVSDLKVKPLIGE